MLRSVGYGGTFQRSPRSLVRPCEKTLSFEFVPREERQWIVQRADVSRAASKYERLSASWRREERYRQVVVLEVEVGEAVQRVL